ADVAEEEAQARVVVEVLRHLALLQLVAAEDDEASRVAVRERDLGKAAAKGSGAAGDEDRLAGKAVGGDFREVQRSDVRTAGSASEISQRSVATRFTVLERRRMLVAAAHGCQRDVREGSRADPGRDWIRRKARRSSGAPSAAMMRSGQPPTVSSGHGPD